MIKTYLNGLYASATRLNRHHILDQLPRLPEGLLLDLGCDDGEWTMELARRMGTKNVHGVEIVEERAAQARARGVDVRIADLAQRLPYPDATFDVVHANQVIEHVPDVDLFTAEIHRVLKPGGVVVVSTENASSWHNIFAMALGWQMFSLTNMSGRQLGIGNPIALHRGEQNHLKSWTHKLIFSHRGLREFFLAHDFAEPEIRGAGYHPLPAVLGRWDARHAHFLSLRARKIERAN